jgi:hypothetical protein
MPEVGDAAPAAHVMDRRGRRVALCTYWRDRPAVAVFLRHYG